MERRPAGSGEELVIELVAPVVDRPLAERDKRLPHRLEDRHGTDARLGLWPRQLPARVGPANTKQPPLEVDVSPAQSTKLTEAEAVPSATSKARTKRKSCP